MKKALLIIDVQNDYFPDGRCPLYRAKEALQTIKGLLQAFRKQTNPVIYIQHISQNQSDFFIPNTKGVEIHQEIAPLDTDTVIVKHEPNSFYQTNLQEELIKQGVEELVVCGMMTHMCIDTTVRAAKDYAYKSILIADGCAAKDLLWEGTSITADIVQGVYMASLHQKFANVITSTEFYVNHMD